MQEVSKMSPAMFNNNTLSLNKHFFNPKQLTLLLLLLLLLLLSQMAANVS